MLAALLADLAVYFRRFVVLTSEQQIAVALWTAHTYIWEQADATPYLLVTSAEMGSGKTRLLECLQHVIHEPISTAASVTPAALFRCIQEWKPTLLIDETDAIFKGRHGELSEHQEALRGILNAGYRRGATVLRVNATAGNKVEMFDVYGPKAMAGIGQLPPTITDRGLVIRLARRKPEEPLERGRWRTLQTAGGELRQRLEEWSSTFRVDGTWPTMPNELDDRAQDAYEILFYIAMSAGDIWPGIAGEALPILRSGSTARRESVGLLLLKDLADVVTRFTESVVKTPELLEVLYAEGEQPWKEWWQGPGETNYTSIKAARRLALAMTEYGVHPERWREGPKTCRGYSMDALKEVISRYLPMQPDTPDTSLQI